ncbi:MAG: hypothetical protein ACE5IT_00095 [bacterium]
MKKVSTGIILVLGIFLFTGFVLGGKTKWEYKVMFLMPEERARFYTTALRDWEELGVESEEFRDFCERFYPQGLSPGSELEALKSFKEFELERIKKKGMPTFAEQEEFLNNLGKDDWELIGVDTHGDSGLPVGYFKRKGKSKERKSEKVEPITPFDFPDRAH